MSSQLQLSTGEQEFKKLNDALEHGVSPELRSMFNNLPTADTAHLLESSPPKLRSLLWRLLDHQQEGGVLQKLSDEVRQFFLEKMNITELESIIQGQDADDIADLLQQLPNTITQQVLASLNSQDRQRIEAVLLYPEDTAGGLMNTDTITVHPDNTIDVVFRYLRTHHNIPTMTDSLIVVNSEDKYLGQLPLITLLTCSPSCIVHDVMISDIKPITVDCPQHQVAQIFERQNLISASVVSDEGKLLGRITIDDVIEVIREESRHSLMSMAGLDDDVDTFAPPLQAFRKRALWLGINLITAFIAASVVGIFQHTIDKVVALAVLMPIVAGMGGNAGGQAFTLILRGIALGQISKTNLRWLMGRELIVGFLNGLLWAVLVSVVVWFWFQDTTLCFVIGCAMLINLTFAVLLGAGLPIFLQTMRIDPTVSGTIVITTFSDVIGFISFLGLATLFFA